MAKLTTLDGLAKASASTSPSLMACATAGGTLALRVR